MKSERPAGHIFFDLEDTLWTSKHPVLQAAWDRLPFAVRQRFGSLPEKFRWQDHAGSTDIAVVMNVVRSLRTPFDHSMGELSNLEVARSILMDMASYYMDRSPLSIRPAVYPDVLPTLSRLRRRGFAVGIASGNDGRSYIHQGRSIQGVGPYKLQQAGLSGICRDTGLHFWGGEEAYHTRAALLEAAMSTQILRTDGRHKKALPPFIYVADAPLDLDATLTLAHNIDIAHKPMDVYLILRQKGSWKSYCDEMVSAVERRGSGVEIDYGYSDLGRGFRDGILFRYKDLPDGRYARKNNPQLFIHVVPNLRAMFRPGGLIVH